MIRFDSDYTRGAHERIMQKLMETNMTQTSGYGTDTHCQRAHELIQEACMAPHADVHLLVGGTQTNLTVIAHVLKPYQAVISAETGHVNTSETGAIEAAGHKVLTIPTADGKMTASQVRDMLKSHFEDAGRIHTPQPGLLYLSQSTETGLLYTLAELKAMRAVCDEFNIPLFIDGARLGYALASPNNDAKLADLARLCDVFYIGGTKQGALFGEALVITNDTIKKDFRYTIKQRGALLAKGRLLGIQFETLFEDDLYLSISKNAIQLVSPLKEAFDVAGIKFQYPVTTNQLFPILTKAQFKKLSEKYALTAWEEKSDTHLVARICTDWSTHPSHVEELASDIRNL